MRYHNITHDDMLNGDGLRAVLWVSGCEHRCEGCHNPITWDETSGLIFDAEAEDELFGYLKKAYISGITFSGGDPLFPANRSEVARIAKRVKEETPEKTIWLYTGYVWEQICNLPVIQYADVLVDGKYIKELADPKLFWRGSSNQRVINVPETLDKKQIVLYTK